MVTWVAEDDDDFTGPGSNVTIDAVDLSGTGGYAWEVTTTSYDVITGTGGNAAKIRCDTGSRNGLARLDSWTGDHQRADMGEVGRDQCGPACHITADTDGEAYVLAAASQFGAWTIYAYPGPSGIPFNGVAVGSGGSNRTGSETSISLRATGDPATSVTLEGFINGSTDVGPHTDTTYLYSGRPGVCPWSNNVYMDDFDAYSDSDEGGGGATPHNPLGHPLRGPFGGPIG